VIPVKTIEWRAGEVRILDQRALPGRKVYLRCSHYREVVEAIRTLAARGAPLIGITAAYGVALAAWHSRARDVPGLRDDVRRVVGALERARPTAVNLFWALRRMERVAATGGSGSVASLRERLLREALGIHDEDRSTCAAIGRNGAKLLRRGATVLTHCNAGALATGGMGTALAVIYAANQAGKGVRVYADETRPLLQGARLTAWELRQCGVDVTLICDSVAASVLRERRADCVIVGADRIAANGDTANKVGTLGLAVLAREYGIPFYVAAPRSTFDFSLRGGEAIPIEERSAEEVVCLYGTRVAPFGTRVYSPAFDITPARYISGIITEHGVALPPFAGSLRKLRQEP
jgi:methylthioribose-1-phosphate isomerase